MLILADRFLKPIPNVGQLQGCVAPTPEIRPKIDRGPAGRLPKWSLTAAANLGMRIYFDSNYLLGCGEEGWGGGSCGDTPPQRVLNDL
jgi:hypothetical protein